MRSQVSPPTKNMVYTVAFGAPEYFELAELMFRSLRLTGWRGEAVCLVDTYRDFPPELGVDVIEVVSATPRPDWKCILAELVDLKFYHNVLFVDSDILFLRNPAEYLGRDFPAVQVAQVDLPLRASRFNQLYLSAPEKAAIPPELTTVNTGAILFPGALAPAFMAAWSAYHLANRKPPVGVAVTLCDQPALEALLFRGELKADRMPRGYMEIAGLLDFAELSPAALFAHYLGNGNTLEAKQKCRETMAAHLAQLAAKFPK
jgi:hypothetical protein